jgi:putative redox protein
LRGGSILSARMSTPLLPASIMQTAGMSPNALCAAGSWPRICAAMLRAATWAIRSVGKPVLGIPIGVAVICKIPMGVFDRQGLWSLVSGSPLRAAERRAAGTTSPTELFVASLASCVAFYAGRFLVRHGLDRVGLAVSAEFTMASDRPARVGSVRLRLTVPGGVPAERRDALIAVASHCTVHNTLRNQPAVAISLA